MGLLPGIFSALGVLMLITQHANCVEYQGFLQPEIPDMMLSKEASHTKFATQMVDENVEPSLHDSQHREKRAQWNFSGVSGNVHNVTSYDEQLKTLDFRKIEGNISNVQIGEGRREPLSYGNVDYQTNPIPPISPGYGHYDRYPIVNLGNVNPTPNSANIGSPRNSYARSDYGDSHRNTDSSYGNYDTTPSYESVGNGRNFYTNYGRIGSQESSSLGYVTPSYGSFGNQRNPYRRKSYDYDNVRSTSSSYGHVFNERRPNWRSRNYDIQRYVDSIIDDVYSKIGPNPSYGNIDDQRYPGYYDNYSQRQPLLP